MWGQLYLCISSQFKFGLQEHHPITTQHYSNLVERCRGAHECVWIHAMWQRQVDSSNITFDFEYVWQELVNGEIPTARYRTLNIFEPPLGRFPLFMCCYSRLRSTNLHISLKDVDILDWVCWHAREVLFVYTIYDI